MHVETLSGDALPEVFEFLFQVGKIAATDFDSPKYFVLTLPNLSFSAQMIALGALSEMNDSGVLRKRPRPVDLKVGDLVTWLTADKLHVKCGTFLGIPQESARSKTFQLAPIGSSSQTFRFLDKFDEFKFAPYFGPSFKHERRLSANPQLVAEFSQSDGLNLTTQSRNEICLIGEPRLSAELLTPSFSITGIPGCGDDILRVENLFDLKESPHYLSRFVKTMSPKADDPKSQIAIFDGAAAYQRHANYLSAQTKFILLSRWDKNSVDAIVKLKKLYAKSRGEPIKLGKLKTPRGVELMTWRTNAA